MDSLLYGLLALLKFVAEVVLDCVFTYFFHTAGWLALRLLSLGRHPRQPLRLNDPLGRHDKWVTAFGILCVVVLPLAILVLISG